MADLSPSKAAGGGAVAVAVGKRVIFVCRNEASYSKVEFELTEKMTMKQLTKAVGGILGMKNPIKKVYRLSGAEVNNLSEVSKNDCLFFSSGEPFYQRTVDSYSIVILGAGGVGKSSITLRFIRNVFISNWEPTIEDAYKYTIKIDEKCATLNILDTAGQEDFSSMRVNWMSNQDGYVFVYSVVSRDSVAQLSQFVDLLEQVVEEGFLVPPIIVVGNKSDLIKDLSKSEQILVQRELSQLIELCHHKIERINESFELANVSKIEGKTGLPVYRRIKHIEVSALRGDSISEIFTLLVREIRGQKSLQAAITETPYKKSSWSCQIL